MGVLDDAKDPHDGDAVDAKDPCDGMEVEASRWPIYLCQKSMSELRVFGYSLYFNQEIAPNRHQIVFCWPVP